MSRRAQGDYFSIFTKKYATGNQPTQDGKLKINAEMLEAMTDIARSQQMDGQPIDISVGLGFWVQTAKESGEKYMRGKPSVFVTDDMEEKLKQLHDHVAQASDQSISNSDDDLEIPF